jgi:hypothetical protein
MTFSSNSGRITFLDSINMTNDNFVALRLRKCRVSEER